MISHYPDRWCIIFWSPSAGSCVTDDSEMTAIVREKLECISRREWKKAREKMIEKMEVQRKREKERERGKKRQNRALVWGSRRLIHVSKWDRRPPSLLDLFLSVSFFIPRYRMLRIFLAAANTVPPLFLECQGPSFRHTYLNFVRKLIRQTLL